MSSNHPYGRCELPLEQCNRCIVRCSINETDWLDSTTAIVTWYYEHSSMMHTCEVQCEPEGADPSVGIMAAYVTADGDCPLAILDTVAAQCAEKLSEEADNCREYDKYDYLDREADDYAYPEDDY